MIDSAADQFPFLLGIRCCEGKETCLRVLLKLCQAVSSSRRAVIAATALLALLFSIAAM